VITTLKAPADMMNSEILEELNLTENTKSTGGRKVNISN
jgi:hypothetical protein